MSTGVFKYFNFIFPFTNTCNTYSVLFYDMKCRPVVGKLPALIMIIIVSAKVQSDQGLEEC